MKRLHVLMMCMLFSVTCLIFAGCKAGSSTFQNPLEREAIDLAETKCFAHEIIKCGDLTYMKTFHNMVGNREYVRSRERKISVNSSSLSQSDKMNGVEWRGAISFTLFGPYQTATENGGYGEWREGSIHELSVRLEKKQGRWSGDWPTYTYNALTCEEALNPTVRR